MDNIKLTRAQEIFKSVKDDYKNLLKNILRDERCVMHLQRRRDIHQNIYDHIRRVIK